VAVDAEALQHHTDLVGEADLESVECVADVLDRLGDLDGAVVDRRMDARRAPRPLRARPRSTCEDGERRVIEILDARALAQESGL